MELVGDLVKFGFVGVGAVLVQMVAGSIFGQFGLVGAFATIAAVSVGGTVLKYVHVI
jgi:putative flippase GtrA